VGWEMNQPNATGLQRRLFSLATRPHFLQTNAGSSTIFVNCLVFFK
jgi:hypothetical protein